MKTRASKGGMSSDEFVRHMMGIQDSCNIVFDPSGVFTTATHSGASSKGNLVMLFMQSEMAICCDVWNSGSQPLGPASIARTISMAGILFRVSLKIST